MLDIKELRKSPSLIEQKLKTKDSGLSLSPVIELDERIRHLKTENEEEKAQRNTLSKEIGQKKQTGKDASLEFSQVSALGEGIHKRDQKIAQLEEELHKMLASLPNLPMEEIPISPSPKDNVCIKKWGEKRIFDFPFKNHLELNEKLHLFDFTRSAKLSGSGWPLYINLGARLEWALLNFMLDTHRKNGFLPLKRNSISSISFLLLKQLSTECISTKFSRKCACL
jgi:seryl-tRNA synthetase